MKITLTKKTAIAERKLAKGTTLSVTNEYGEQLIEKGYAVKFGETPQTNEDEQINTSESWQQLES